MAFHVETATFPLFKHKTQKQDKMKTKTQNSTSQKTVSSNTQASKPLVDNAPMIALQSERDKLVSQVATLETKLASVKTKVILKAGNFDVQVSMDKLTELANHFNPEQGRVHRYFSEKPSGRQVISAIGSVHVIEDQTALKAAMLSGLFGSVDTPSEKQAATARLARYNLGVALIKIAVKL